MFSVRNVTSFSSRNSIFLPFFLAKKKNSKRFFNGHMCDKGIGKLSEACLLQIERLGGEFIDFKKKNISNTQKKKAETRKTKGTTLSIKESIDSNKSDVNSKFEVFSFTPTVRDAFDYNIEEKRNLRISSVIEYIHFVKWPEKTTYYQVSNAFRKYQYVNNTEYKNDKNYLEYLELSEKLDENEEEVLYRIQFIKPQNIRAYLNDRKKPATPIPNAIKQSLASGSNPELHTNISPSKKKGKKAALVEATMSPLLGSSDSIDYYDEKLTSSTNSLSSSVESVDAARSQKSSYLNLTISGDQNVPLHFNNLVIGEANDGKILILLSTNSSDNPSIYIYKIPTSPFAQTPSTPTPQEKAQDKNTTPKSTGKRKRALLSPKRKSTKKFINEIEEELLKKKIKEKSFMKLYYMDEFLASLEVENVGNVCYTVQTAAKLSGLSNLPNPNISHMPPISNIPPINSIPPLSKVPSLSDISLSPISISPMGGLSPITNQDHDSNTIPHFNTILNPESNIAIPSFPSFSLPSINILPSMEHPSDYPPVMSPQSLPSINSRTVIIPDSINNAPELNTPANEYNDSTDKMEVEYDNAAISNVDPNIPTDNNPIKVKIEQEETIEIKEITEISVVKEENEIIVKEEITIKEEIVEQPISEDQQKDILNMAIETEIQVTKVEDIEMENTNDVSQPLQENIEVKVEDNQVNIAPSELVLSIEGQNEEINQQTIKEEIIEEKTQQNDEMQTENKEELISPHSIGQDERGHPTTENNNISEVEKGQETDNLSKEDQNVLEITEEVQTAPESNEEIVIQPAEDEVKNIEPQSDISVDVPQINEIQQERAKLIQENNQQTDVSQSLPNDIPINIPIDIPTDIPNDQDKILPEENNQIESIVDEENVPEEKIDNIININDNNDYIDNNNYNSSAQVISTSITPPEITQNDAKIVPENNQDNIEIMHEDQPNQQIQPNNEQSNEQPEVIEEVKQEIPQESTVEMSEESKQDDPKAEQENQGVVSTLEDDNQMKVEENTLIEQQQEEKKIIEHETKIENEISSSDQSVQDPLPNLNIGNDNVDISSGSMQIEALVSNDIVNNNEIAKEINSNIGTSANTIIEQTTVKSVEMEEEESNLTGNETPKHPVIRSTYLDDQDFSLPSSAQSIDNNNITSIPPVKDEAMDSGDEEDRQLSAMILSQFNPIERAPAPPSIPSTPFLPPISSLTSPSSDYNSFVGNDNNMLLLASASDSLAHYSINNNNGNNHNMYQSSSQPLSSIGSLKYKLDIPNRYQYITHLNLRSLPLNIDPQSTNDFTPQKQFEVANLLAHFVDQISLLTNLVSVNLAKTNLQFLPAKIFTLPKLTYLAINDNQLTQIPEISFSLSSIEYINLSNNQISKLPTYSTPRLRYLNCSSNLIESLDDHFCSNMKSLKVKI